MRSCGLVHYCIRSKNADFGVFYRGVNHGTFLHLAHEEGLIRNTSAHAGIRGPLASRKGDTRNDKRCGFEMITAREIDRIGVQQIIEKLKARVGDSKVYISVDIDVLDPAYAPGKWDIRGVFHHNFVILWDCIHDRLHENPWNMAAAD
jgi:hypothetical protein